MTQSMNRHIYSDIRHRGTCSQGCPLELLFPVTAGFWRLRYCDDQRRENCARKQFLDRGDHAPDGLTPSGVVLPNKATGHEMPGLMITVSTAKRLRR